MDATLASAPPAGHLDRFEPVRFNRRRTDLKNVEDAAHWRPLIGRALARAIQIAGLSQKEAAALIGRDQAQVARWIAGSERPQLDAIFAVSQLREPLVIALANLTACEVAVEIRIRRSA